MLYDGSDFLAPVNKEVRQPIIINQALFNDFYEGRFVDE